MKTALQHAMHVVDSDTTEVGDTDAKAAEAVAEVAQVHPDIAKIAEDHIEQAARAADIAAQAEATRQNHKLIIDSLARTMVTLAASLGGQDSRYTRPADTMHADNIAAILMGVRDSEVMELPAAFRQASADVDLKRAAAVGAVLAGG